MPYLAVLKNPSESPRSGHRCGLFPKFNGFFPVHRYVSVYEDPLSSFHVNIDRRPETNRGGTAVKRHPKTWI